MIILVIYYKENVHEYAIFFKQYRYKVRFAKNRAAFYQFKSQKTQCRYRMEESFADILEG
jgi:hypothetical protein